jgi:S-adenosylmethionine:diacylglycerol 3-amino-3-carboxypropyl transferase
MSRLRLEFRAFSRYLQKQQGVVLTFADDMHFSASIDRPPSETLSYIKIKPVKNCDLSGENRLAIFHRFGFGISARVASIRALFAARLIRLD